MNHERIEFNQKLSFMQQVQILYIQQHGIIYKGSLCFDNVCNDIVLPSELLSLHENQ